jgi:hypothetical protein
MNLKHVSLIGALIALVAGSSYWLGTKSNAVQPQISEIRPVAQASRHAYEIRDGMKYGYSAAVSDDQKRAGQVASAVMMFSYAGQRDGKHQLHTTDGTVFTAIECSDPCDVMKVMTFVDKDYLRQNIKVEYLKNTVGSVANFALSDAFKGYLNQYGIERGGVAHHVWMDEQKGLRESPIKPKK